MLVAKKWREPRERMPAAGRKRNEETARRLAAEVEMLHQLRDALGLTQEEVARRLGIGQPGVSRLERRSDVTLSTLYEYVRALGGELEVTGHFPHGDVVIRQFEPASPVPDENRSRLANVEPDPGYLKVDPESLVHLDWSEEWRP